MWLIFITELCIDKKDDYPENIFWCEIDFSLGCRYWCKVAYEKREASNWKTNLIFSKQILIDNLHTLL